jgi:predicted acetylornithine/succinylornithine family transaminase
MTVDYGDYEDGGRRMLELADRVLAPTYGRPPCLMVDGRGARLRDAAGRELLDMSSGIAVLALGHRSETVAGALRRAADRLVHVSNLYHTAPPVELARRLVDLSFADRVFFANSGSEAVEAAIKFARLAGGSERREVVAFSGSFHGRTLGSLAATDRPAHRDPFEPLPAGFRFAPWNEAAATELIDERTAAAIVEPIQGEQGVRVADEGWLAALRRRCDEVGALLIFDEIQCGLGRSGSLWAHERSGVCPDMMTLAKPLGGGLPIGALLLTERVARPITPGVHGTTFGANPLVAAVAVEVLERIVADGFLAAVRDKGAELKSRIAKLDHPLVEEIRGRGLMLGVRVDAEPKAVVDAAYEQGLLVVPSAQNVVRLLPPLDVAGEDIARCVDLLGRALERVAEGRES